MNTKKSILPELKNFDIPDNIRYKADSIYKEMHISTKRGDRRRQLFFVCIYYAYKESNDPKDPTELALLLNLQKSDITKALNMFSEIQTEYKPMNKNISPLELLPNLCKEVGFENDSINTCVAICEEILKKDAELSEQYPKKVAAGIIEYFLTIKGVAYNKKLLSDKMGLSTAAMHTMSNRISNIHNS